MLPETDFHKRKSMMFLIIRGRYYAAANSSFVDQNYIEFCGLRFPLARGRELSEEEESYLKKNQKAIQLKKAEIDREINNGKGIEDLAKELEAKQDLHFFLTNICRPDNFHLKTRDLYQIPEFVNSLAIDSRIIFSQLIDRDYAVINGRLYPLKLIEQPGFVCFNRKNYTFDPSSMTVQDVENSFHEIILRRIRAKSIEDSGKFKEIGQAIMELDEKNKVLQEDLGVSKYPHAYEYGNTGFDTTLKVIYCLIPPHYNHTTEKSYSEGQSAATVPFEKGEIGVIGTFTERTSKDYSFARSTRSHCLGDLRYEGSSLEEKMLYLRKVSLEIYENGGFYQQSTSSSDDNYGY